MTPAGPLAVFSAPTREWFASSFAEPTSAQTGGWEAISRGEHTLIHAPTGSGKTLAAFLWAIDRLLSEPQPPPAERCRVLYISPLKALAHDIDRNLRAPLVGIRRAAERAGLDTLPELTTFLRTGDTPAPDRRRMQRHPPDLLITTPESLYLILTSQASTTLAPVRYVIVDEVHAVAGTKRGAHLALSLERLEEITQVSPQRIGLSATQRPLETIAWFLGGCSGDGETSSPRPVTIVDAPRTRDLEVELVVPVEDMSQPALADPLDPEVVTTRSIWPAIYPRILDLIRQHRSSIVFANSRRLAERLCNEINVLAGEEIARAHHGSVSREQRVQIEEALKRGELAAVVATSSLELGIDMGAVDLVIQVESPVTVASGLQRVGRSGHQVGGASRAKVFPKYRADLLVATVVVDRMIQGQVEATTIPRNPLDVLSQQLVAMVVTADRSADDLYRLVRRAAPFAGLARSVFDATLDMLSGLYPSDLFAELRPRVTYDRVTGTVSPRPGARQLAVANAGTIPDRGLYRVTLPDGSRVGELDEEMVYESRAGDVFLLGASAWRIIEIGPDRVEVVPTPAEPGAHMPFWHGDMSGRAFETGRAIGAFIGEIGGLDSSEARKRMVEDFRLDKLAAANLVAYLDEERSATGVLPTDQNLVVERFRDEIGDWRVVILSPFGARVHAPWAMAVTHRLRGRFGTDADVIWSDDGIVFRFSDTDDLPTAADLVLDPDEIEELVVDQLPDTALFAARFREAAGRALLLPRRRPGNRTPLWLQRRRAADLLGVARQFGTFPIVLETYREVLQDDFDLASLQTVMRAIRSRDIRLTEVETQTPSPFASSLLFAFVAAYLYEGDTPLAERRAAALTLDRGLLRDLLGEGDLAELIPPGIVAELELALQGLDKMVEGTDAVHDLLRRLGPLTVAGLVARVVDPDDLLTKLEHTRRAVRVRIGGEEHWAAIEDVARLRDALGIQPPPGIPDVFLQPVPDPLADVIGRYARTHGPFSVAAVAAELRLPLEVARLTLVRLEAAGRVTSGSLGEFVDSEVLRRLKRRALAMLRREIEPVDPTALARFLPGWQGVAENPPRGRSAAAAAVRVLQGAAIPASVLESEVLGRRVADPDRWLDQMMIEGELAWIGRGALGPRDGKLALYFRNGPAGQLSVPTQPGPDGAIHHRLRQTLNTRGACFFADLYTGAGGGDPGVMLEALWDLVWAGEVTNDTLAPVRAYLGRRRPSPRPHLSGTFPPHAAGRWALVSETTESTRRAAAWTEQLLDRHGVLTRPAVLGEGAPGGFAGIYPILTQMEEIGRIRRGYFVEGLGGAQFARPGAVDRVRNQGSTGIVTLAATDPANAYGVALDWPPVGSGRLGRIAGAWVILADGRLAAFVDGHRIRVLDPEPDLRPSLSGAVAEIAARQPRFRVETIDDQPVGATPWSSALLAVGFVPAPRGLVYRLGRR